MLGSGEGVRSGVSRDPAAAHACQLKRRHGNGGRVDEGICRRDLPRDGRAGKPRRFWQVRPLVTFPRAPGLSHTLPGD
jgi:hypothetical protein